MRELVEKFEKTLKERDELFRKVEYLDWRYENKKLKYLDYEEKLNRILKNRPRNEVKKEYNDYLRKLLNEIEILNQQLLEPSGYEINNPVEKPSVSKKIDKENIDELEKRIKSKIKSVDAKKSDSSKKIPRTRKNKAIKEKGLLKSHLNLKLKDKRVLHLPNLIFNKFGFNFLKYYPALFSRLQNALRAADFKLLSVTYINLMLFFSSLAFIIGTPVLIFIFLYIRDFLYLAVAKGIFFGLLLSVLVFLIFYSYPISKANQKRRSIDVNLPFAIHHIQAISSADIEPDKVFKFVSGSKEYGQLTAEFKKIDNYIHYMGYDFVTAIDNVVKVTPSSKLKEFIQGLASTIQSGGDVKNYLVSEAKQAESRYEIDRKKYLDSISTIADIYTGVMVAGPVMLILVVVLMAMFGSTIAGIAPVTALLFGVYLVLPVLNIGFIIFLQIINPGY